MKDVYTLHFSIPFPVKKYSKYQFYSQGVWREAISRSYFAAFLFPTPRDKKENHFDLFLFYAFCTPKLRKIRLNLVYKTSFLKLLSKITPWWMHGCFKIVQIRPLVGAQIYLFFIENSMKFSYSKTGHLKNNTVQEEIFSFTVLNLFRFQSAHDWKAIQMIWSSIRNHSNWFLFQSTDALNKST